MAVFGIVEGVNWYRIGIPIFAFICLSRWLSTIDLACAHYFFPFQKDLLPYVFRYGPYLSIGVAVISLLWAPFSANWRPLVFLVLTLLLGSGLLTNLVLKDHFERPRPRQVEMFGGPYAYRPPLALRWNWYNDAKSFPSGHASSGFYFLSFVFVGRFLRKGWLVALGWTLGLCMGGGLGVMRMAQGGHFFSDVVAAGVLMWCVASLLADLLLAPKTEPQRT